MFDPRSFTQGKVPDHKTFLFCADVDFLLFVQRYTVAAFRFRAVQLHIGALSPQGSGRTHPFGGIRAADADGDLERHHR